MKRFMMATLLGVAVMAGPAVGAQISFGIRIGPPPPPRAERIIVRPAREYVWVGGYWYPVGNHWKWHRGYWTRAPYEGAHWLTPRYEGGQYYEGYWEGGRGRFEHNHAWDHDRYRDYRERDHDRDHDRDRDHR